MIVEKYEVGTYLLYRYYVLFLQIINVDMID